MRIVSLAFVLVFVFAGAATAMDKTPTKRSVTVHSSNGQFRLHADCNKKTVEIFKAEGDAPAWSFDYNVMHDEFLLSDDGETVVILWWPRSVGDVKGERVAIRFWNRRKGEINSHRLDVLCDDFGGIGNQSIPFIGGINSWHQSPVVIAGDSLHVVTLDSHKCSFSVRTGELVDRHRVLSFWEKVLIVIAAIVFTIVAIIVAFFVGLFGLLYSLLTMRSR